MVHLNKNQIYKPHLTLTHYAVDEFFRSQLQEDNFDGTVKMFVHKNRRTLYCTCSCVVFEFIWLKQKFMHIAFYFQ